MQMIDRDTNLDARQRERQKDALREVLRFCQNKTDCRRSQVLAFFDERDFDPVECKQGCDVCSSRDDTTITIKDVTDDAKRMLQMLDAFGRGEQITMVNMVDCFRGTNGNSSKGLGNNPHFACGKDWDRTDAERLVQTLSLERAIDDYITTNAGGWSNSYMKVSLLNYPVSSV